MVVNFAYLVIGVHLAAAEEDEDVGQEVVAERPKPGQRRDGRRPHRRALQQHTVVDEADVPAHRDKYEENFVICNWV